MCRSFVENFVTLLSWRFVLKNCFLIAYVASTPLSVNLDQTRVSQRSNECVSANGTKGLCVPEVLCTADHRLLQYGNIYDSELREKKVEEPKQCGDFEWCCFMSANEDSEEETEKPPTRSEDKETAAENGITSLSSIACTPLESTDCPWCVTLHKGVINDGLETGLYCMGSMVGPKVVLTSASCIRAAQNLTMWVQVPTAVKPKQIYGVRYTKRHPLYNSGTHEYDYGLVILEENVYWGQNNWVGVCLGLETAVSGECIGFGFDGNDQIVSTLLKSSSGGCTAIGDTEDVACSRKFAREHYCFIAAGSPVVCRNSDVVGVARTLCFDDAALVGTLFAAKDWITAELKKLNVSPSNYVKNRV